MGLLTLVGFMGRLGLSVYYYIYVIGRPDLIGIMMMLPSLLAAVVMFIFKGITDSIGKKRLFIISNIGTAFVLFLIFILNPVNNPTLLIVLTAFYGVTNGLGMPVFLSLVPDAIDYMEDKTGVRADGTSYTAVSLGTKIASAVGASIGLLIMSTFGYMANAQQTESGIMGISVATNLFPAIFFLLSNIPALIYPLSKEKNREIRERLIKKGSTGISAQN
jgi:GPH family glycoside/pentoside/hexuronide:cation symporter/probable glucitol transport protein GutA